MKASPTVYNEVLYRSRLEARWAAFFDLCGWSYTYEPFSFGDYIPDFIINGKTNLLVEVKPVPVGELFDDNTPEDLRKKAEEYTDPEVYEPLILGLPKIDGDGFVLGWLGEWCNVDEEDCWEWASAGLFENEDESPGIVHSLGGYHCRISGAYLGGGPPLISGNKAQTMWNVAGNKVQWNPPIRRPA